MSSIAYNRLRGYKYRLSRDAEARIPVFSDLPDIEDPYYSIKGGVVHVKAGYSWDGASGPTWDDDTVLRGSLFHDVLYQAIRAGKIPATRRADADYAIYQIMKADGAWGVRALVWFIGLRIAGAPSTKPRKVEPIDTVYFAPAPKE